MHLIWKAALEPGRSTRLQVLPILPGLMLVASDIMVWKSSLTWTFASAVCDKADVPRVNSQSSLTLPQLGCELESFKLDATASRKHELKKEIQGLV